jgi:hypothetical protein
MPSIALPKAALSTLPSRFILGALDRDEARTEEPAFSAPELQS